MILFWLICAGLLAIALAFILPTLLQTAPVADERDNDETNVEVYRSQLSELDADLANGIVSPEQYQPDRDEIERRLLADVANVRQETSKPFGGGSLRQWGFIVIAIGACSFSVLLFGSRFRAINVLQQGQPTIGIILLTLGGLFLVMRSNRSTAYALAVALPILAVAIYLKVGEVHAGERVQAPFAANGQMTQQGIEANVAALAKRMEQNPGDADGWAMLGRSYINLEKYTEASNAYAKAVALKADDADLLTEYAFALAMVNNRQLQGQPAELVKKALQIDPENPKALQLAGTAEFEAKNYNQAIVYWQKLLAKSSGSPELAQSVSQRIEEAKTLAKASGK
jgi:cytochrome c-type biogenesis protein CcmH